MQLVPTVCGVCGKRWKTDWIHSPKNCIDEHCDASWLDIRQFWNEHDADRFHANPKPAVWA